MVTADAVRGRTQAKSKAFDHFVQRKGGFNECVARVFERRGAVKKQHEIHLLRTSRPISATVMVAAVAG
jgi:hypothetical protein